MLSSKTHKEELDQERLFRRVFFDVNIRAFTHSLNIWISNFLRKSRELVIAVKDGQTLGYRDYLLLGARDCG
jgi:hypothetical protein